MVISSEEVEEEYTRQFDKVFRANTKGWNAVNSSCQSRLLNWEYGLTT